jgi:V/A-type H+/Na+-transporting ATPase subunit K
VGPALRIGMIAFSAAIAIGLSALATGLAQSRIGAAMAGAIAERPELVGSAIILVAIPETMVILGFVVAFLITALKTVTK